MNMFCYQCQETGNGKGCTALGMCGKTDETANLQDLLIYTLKGLAFYARFIFSSGKPFNLELKRKTGVIITESLFATITNTNFDPSRILSYTERALRHREALHKEYLKAVDAPSPVPGTGAANVIPESARWVYSSKKDLYQKSYTVGVLETRDPDLRSVKETITYALKGMSAYTYHAAVLGFYDDSIFDFIFDALFKIDTETQIEKLLPVVIKTGEYNLKALEVLDKANTAVYGMPSPVKVRTKPGTRPGILVTGHDLKDLEMLMHQSENQGIDVYTNGEMVLAQSLPFFRKFKHLAGNYGNAWWQQAEEFRSFNGPVLVTSNCIIPPDESYVKRMFTTSVAGFPGIPHIEEKNGTKDFSTLISLAKTLPPPAPLKDNEFMSGFGNKYLLSVKDKVIELVKDGKIKKFIVMGGCDGRETKRKYYKDKALTLPKDTVILTAGCAKYRFIKDISDTIEGIPRVLDAGQCSDNYSFLVFALELAKSLDIKDLNELPIEYDIAWYDQKAVAVLLTLVYLGIKKIKFGPTLPEFLTQYIIKNIKDKSDISTVYKE
ncbi:MAG: hydroxylamine reductase [Elusimicrobia bacterium]|nr:hydroxylamine reductase [Candidatus Liberimonas magnetica]